MNYAIGELDPWGYHVLNIAIHTAACLLLFGIVRRTQRLRGCGPASAGPAFAVALLWALHPLQTQSVTYVVQRAESLMGLLFLLTLYAFIRAIEGRAVRAWLATSAAACLLGMATKEVMVSAPLVVLLYDRTFVAGSFREAIRSRRIYYSSLAATWLPLAFLVILQPGRGGTAGFGSGVSWWRYGLTQADAITHYLRLAFWPRPLVFDYGFELIRTPSEASGALLALAILITATAWMLRRPSAPAFLSAAFFAILSPSSSIIPVATEPMAEHRMYLPLAAVVTAAVFAVRGLLEGMWTARRLPNPANRKATLCATCPLVFAAAAALGGTTFARNRDYRNELAIWRDTVEKNPGNPRAESSLGLALADAGRLPEALAAERKALRLDPGFVDCHNNLGSVLSEAGRWREAAVQYALCTRIQPVTPLYHYNLACALDRLGNRSQAEVEFRTALRLAPAYPEAHDNLGIILAETGRRRQALPEFESAIHGKPEQAQFHCDLANTLAGIGRMGDAIREYRRALRLDPRYIEARNNLGTALLSSGRPQDAIPEFCAVLRLRPDLPGAEHNLGSAFLAAGRPADAIPHLEAALRANPDDSDARSKLETARRSLASKR